MHACVPKKQRRRKDLQDNSGTKTHVDRKESVFGMMKMVVVYGQARKQGIDGRLQLPCSIRM
jgi:hypothetical protein